MNMEQAHTHIATTLEKVSKFFPAELLKSQVANLAHLLQEKASMILERLGGLEPIDLLKNRLMDAHHPYGLLLNASPVFIGAGGGIDASGMASISSLSASAQGSSGLNQEPSANLFKNVSSAAFLGLSSSANSPQASLLSTGSALSSMYTEVGGEKVQSGEPVLGALSSILGLSAGSDPTIAHIVQQSFAVGGGAQAEAMIMPLMMSAKPVEVTLEQKEPYEVLPNKIRVGAVVANVYVYKGKKPYMVRRPDGNEDMYVVRPGDKLLTLHVNQPDARYKRLDHIARIKAIRRDFVDLCKMLENPTQFDLSARQISQIEELRRAPIIGVSHLVRLIASRGLPTWKVDILPKILRRFHALDSQVVSRQFGGTRKVSADDIGVMFLPPTLRGLVDSRITTPSS